MNIRSQGARSERVLCKAFELASPHLHLVVIIDDVVVRLEAAMMEILILVDAGVDIMLEGCPHNRSECIMECGIGGTYSFLQRPSPKSPLSYDSI
jgi:hypothetical protein